LDRFDGFALQHRFEITDEGRVYYRSRRTCDDYIQRIQERGKAEFTFGQKDLCDAFFHKFFTMFKNEDSNSRPAAGNIQVTFTPNFPIGPKLTDQSHRDKTGLRNLYVKTDANRLRSLDPVTLDPVKNTNYTDIAPELSGPLAASHAAVDPETGELFNYILKFGQSATYTLFKLTPPTADESSGHKVLATITDAPGAYIHSLCITKKYVVFCVWQADFSYNGLSILYYKNEMQSFKSWNPDRDALWYIIDREQGSVVRRYKSKTFFAFHHINSFDDGDNIVVDLVTFSSHEVLNGFYIDALKSTSATKLMDPIPLATRVILENVTSDSRTTGTANIITTTACLELPTISTPYLLRPNKYVYGVSSRGLSSLWDCILKVDLEELYKNPSDPDDNAIKRWSLPKCTPSEPIFVPRPGGTKEDDGVVLTVVLDGVKGASALVVIDGQTFTEIGRAELDGPGFVVPHGFHGAWCGN
jgi:torulene dioxygenase